MPEIMNLDLSGHTGPFVANYTTVDNCGESQTVTDVFTVDPRPTCEIQLGEANGLANRRYYAGGVQMRGALAASFPDVYDSNEEALADAQSAWNYPELDMMLNVMTGHNTPSSHYMLGADGLEYMLNELDSNGQPVLRDQVVSASGLWGIQNNSDSVVSNFVVDDTTEGVGEFEFWITSARIVLPCDAGREASVKFRISTIQFINESMIWAWKGERGNTLDSADVKAWYIRSQANTDDSDVTSNETSEVMISIGEYIDFTYASFDAYGAVKQAKVEISINGGDWFSITEEQDLVDNGMAITSLY